MKTPQELKYELLAVDAAIVTQVTEIISTEAEKKFVFRNLVDLDETASQLKTNVIRVPKFRWTEAGTIAPAQDYSFRSPNITEYKEITIKKIGDGVKVPDEWDRWTPPSVLNTELKNVAYAIAAGEDTLIANEILGRTSAGTETVGTANASGSATFSLANKPVIQVHKVLKGNNETNEYVVDYYDGKIRVNCASGDVVKVVYDYSTRTYYYQPETPGQISLGDILQLSANFEANKYTPDWGVVNPASKAKILNGLKDMYVSTNLYKPIYTGEIGQLAGIPFVTSKAVPPGVVVIGAKPAVKYLLQEGIRVERVRDPDSDSTLIKAHILAGVGVIWEEGIALLTNAQDNAANL